MAASKADQLDRECDGDACPPSLEDVRDSGQTLATATDILWISGALAAGAGVTLFLLDDGDSEAPAVEAGCFAASCGVPSRLMHSTTESTISWARNTNVVPRSMPALSVAWFRIDATIPAATPAATKQTLRAVHRSLVSRGTCGMNRR